MYVVGNSSAILGGGNADCCSAPLGAQAQILAPGIGVSGNKMIATTAGTLGLHPVSAGQTLDLRGVNFSGSEYTCSTGTGFWDNPAGNQTTINHMRDD